MEKGCSCCIAIGLKDLGRKSSLSSPICWLPRRIFFPIPTGWSRLLSIVSVETGKTIAKLMQSLYGCPKIIHQKSFDKAILRLLFRWSDTTITMFLYVIAYAIIR